MSKKEIILEFTKDKRSTNYSWEQPNVPWIIDKTGKKQKLVLDINKKLVYVLEKDEEGKYKPEELRKYLVKEYNLDEYSIMLQVSSAEIFWEMILDLKRNIHNQQHQKILFTVDKNELGFSKNQSYQQTKTNYDQKHKRNIHNRN